MQTEVSKLHKLMVIPSIKRAWKLRLVLASTVHIEQELFYSQPFAMVIATVGMVAELVFIQGYVSATVDGQHPTVTVIHVRLQYIALY